MLNQEEEGENEGPRNNQEELDRIDGLSQMRRQQRLIGEEEPSTLDDRLGSLEFKIERIFNILENTNRSLRSLRAI